MSVAGRWDQVIPCTFKLELEDERMERNEETSALPNHCKSVIVAFDVYFWVVF